ncbi:MAG: ATP phosphoribosyltransferase [Pseudomonadota bacterium]
MTLRLGLPSKGRLQADAIAWFAARGVTVARTGSDRAYAGRIDGAEGVELVLLSAGEIPRELAAGRLELGVTGRDMVAERIPGGEARLSALTPMGFGHADLIVAVPAHWIDVETMADLDAAAAAFRARHGRRLRIATKYHTLVRAFFRRHGIADWRIVDSQGATEATVLNETAEAIADITTTGATLTANHLKILEDGLILRSEATLYARPAEALTSAQRALLLRLLQQLGLENATVT